MIDPVGAAWERAASAFKARRFGEALDVFARLASLQPDNAVLLGIIAECQLALEQPALALATAERAMRLKPSPEAAVNVGCAFKLLRDDREAEKAWKRALGMDMERQMRADTLANLAGLTADGIDPKRAIEWADKALRLVPDHAAARWCRAMARLSQGDWLAFDEAEWRRDLPDSKANRALDVEKWRGRPSRLAITGEQGVGDEIMYASCVPDAIGLCNSVVIECQPRLIGLFERSFGVKCHPTAEALKAAGGFDAYVPLGSLPRWFRRATEDFPGTPYLRPDPALVEKWRAVLAATGPRPWIGLSWSGGTPKTHVDRRTVPISRLAPMFAGQTAVSLQYGEMGHAIAQQMGLPSHAEAVGGQSIEDLAAYIACLDLVVSVPTTVVHLAGALGVPCLVMTPHGPSWRYGQAETMPWYGSVTLLRQAKPGDWSAVFHKLEATLVHHAGISRAERRAA